MTGNLRSLPLSWSLLFVFVFQFQWFVVNVLVVQDFAYIVWIFFKRILCLNHSNLSWSWSLFELHFQVIRAIALDESHRDVYRIRCYGMARGFQMTLAMLTGELTDIIPIKVKGELIR